MSLADQEVSPPAEPFMDRQFLVAANPQCLVQITTVGQDVGDPSPVQGKRTLRACE